MKHYTPEELREMELKDSILAASLQLEPMNANISVERTLEAMKLLGDNADRIGEALRNTLKNNNSDQ